MISGGRRSNRLASWAGPVVLLLALTACGGGPGAEPAASPTPEPTAPATTAASVSVAPTSPTPEESPSSSFSEPSEDESDKPPILDQDASGRELTTADFFGVPEGWRDGRFDVAGQRGVTGVAGELYRCTYEVQSNSPEIELRLSNLFSKISMEIAQSDASQSSDSVLFVKLVGNGKYIEAGDVPFNEIETIQAPVAGVNALKIQFWLGGKNCDGEQVEPVVMKLRVE